MIFSHMGENHRTVSLALIKYSEIQKFLKKKFHDIEII